jgi:hypothetical protein
VTRDSFKRENFVRCFAKAGLTFSQSEIAYAAMVHALETAVNERRKIVLGDIGTLTPKLLNPRRVVMSCRGGKTGAAATRKEFILGPRTKYKFNLHHSFGERHGFNT